MSYYEKYLKYKNKYLNLKSLVGSGSKGSGSGESKSSGAAVVPKKKSTYPTRFGRHDNTNRLYVMYKITDEQNLTAIRERQDIILKGNHPVHNTPHLTLFDIRFDASHKCP